ncbi:HNH endonuclease [Cloacibacterium sp. TD35]|uniref:HNH endonuclease n=1 Tax=Cloacibacterium sp. TD35 TaxID=2976818 RepID=UPI00237E390F|nr:HNH endonuclease signature motif containing protein [Cloacibacterium sp. TD35]WDT68009.1 HNH endonuclease [Cloacibacterium sp. TD35]
MKSINRPLENINDILDIFFSDNPQSNVQGQITANRASLVFLEGQYISKVQDNTLFEMPRGIPNIITLSKGDLIRYYKYRMLNKENARKFYDTLLLSAPNNICPYCTIKNVKTVDHFLPKSEYPYLSVVPSNLVPCCRDCNTDKKISYPIDNDTQTYHPYFDNIENESWIKAELMCTEPLSFQFRVERLPHWNDNKFNRSVNHFKTYNINELFSNEANRELRTRQFYFKQLLNRDNIQLIEQIEDTYNSCLNSVGVLDWQTIMYACLKENSWFLQGCNGSDYFL